MSTIVTRVAKGSALTWVEADANFTNLNTDKLQAGAPATAIANTPAGTIAAVTVQAAINELDTEKIATSAIGTTVQAYDADTAKLDVAQTFTAQQTPMNGALTDGATIDWNGNTNGQVVTVTLADNRTMNAPSNIRQYAMYVIRVTQDGTGSRVLAWNAAYKFGTAAAPTLTTTANKVDVLMFIGGATNTLEYIGCRLDAV